MFEKIYDSNILPSLEPGEGGGGLKWVCGTPENNYSELVQCHNLVYAAPCNCSDKLYIYTVYKKDGAKENKRKLLKPFNMLTNPMLAGLQIFS